MEIPPVETYETKGTDLGGKSRRSSNLTSGSTEVDDLCKVGDAM